MNIDIAIIGGGAAGLSAALSFDENLRVAVFAKRTLADCASAWAQGGVAAALSAEDSLQLHVADTLQAGDDLCNAAAAETVAENAPDAIRWLAQQGVKFNRENNDDGQNNFALGREGGHSARRIAHVDDVTGRAVVSALAARAAEKSNIQLIERTIAINLYKKNDKCRGFYALHLDSGQIEEINARATVLATGGASKVYLYATTPPDATGDGIAMAYRLGCRIANMEFVQFHPTCLYHPQAASFLITEAMRGEGAKLINQAGDSFMQKGESELSSRDIVARAIDAEMKKSGADCVYLDLSSRPEEFWRQRFPTIMQRCQQLQLNDLRIPVVPAAHYCCGGVQTDLFGRTDIPGLYAVGETASTGLHGANRLASNSLLECVVIGRRAAEAIVADLPKADNTMPPWDERRICVSSENVMVAHNWEELRRIMWNYVGIVRSDERLQRARRRTEWIGEEIEQHYQRHAVSRDFLELRNLVQCAQLIIESALSRRESRGLHFNLDCPDKNTRAVDTVLSRQNFIKRKDAINKHCPFSGRMIVANSLTDYRGHVVGFCNVGCRDAFATAAAADFLNATDGVLSACEKFNACIDGNGG